MTTRRFVNGALGVLVGLLMTAPEAGAQMADFLGPHRLETLPHEVPATGRIGGVTRDGYGYMYVANQDQQVWKIHPSGEMELFVDGLYGSASGAMLPNGELLHTEWGGDRIWRIERDGTRHLLVGEGIQGPVGIVVVGEHAFAVNHKSDWIARISPEGTVEELVRDPRLRQANGITADPQGNLYVVSLGHTTVLRVTPAGEITEVATLPGTANGHVAFANGSLYVTQIWEHVVLRVGMDGRYEVVAGDGTRSGLPYPNGITARGDAVWFNTLDGNMVSGHTGVIRVHRLTLPTPATAFEAALREGGMEGLRAKFDQAMSLREVPAERLVPALYDIASRFAWRGELEAALALTDWTFEADDQDARRHLNRGRAHLTYGDGAVAVASLEEAARLAPDDDTVARLLESARTYRRLP